MLRFFGNNTISPYKNSKTVVTIGMFDGVHLGHKKVINEVVNIANKENLPAIAITFDVHPKAILGIAPPMICSLEHRLQLLSQQHLTAVWVISFTEEFSKITAEEFTTRFLIDAFSAKHVILGSNGNFGYKGEGNIEFLNAHHPEIQTKCIQKVKINNIPVSSSLIREYTGSGKLKESADLLGRQPSVLGRVVRGKQLGRTIGVPTLNINPDHELYPPTGVYATITRCGDSLFQSITNIGNRPTFNEETRTNIETHLFNFQGNLYDHTIEVFFIHKIRDEKKFSGITELKSNIENDIATAKSILTEERYYTNFHTTF